MGVKKCMNGLSLKLLHKLPDIYILEWYIYTHMCAVSVYGTS